MTKFTTVKKLVKLVNTDKVTLNNIKRNIFSDTEPKTVPTPDELIESMEILAESGVFSKGIDFKFEKLKDENGEDYLAVYAGYMASYMRSIDFELHMNDGVDIDVVVDELTEDAEKLFDEIA